MIVCTEPLPNERVPIRIARWWSCKAPATIGTPDDYQLARAVDMLRGIALFNGRLVN